MKGLDLEAGRMDELSNRGVGRLGRSKAESTSQASVPRFDAYTATTFATTAQEVLPLFVRGEGETVHSCRGHYGFKEKQCVKDHAGDVIGSVMYDGGVRGLIMIEAKGANCPSVVAAIRANWPHRCTRVDSCIDFETPLAFKILLETVRCIKIRHRLYGEKGGDWDFPEFGRTQYLGAPSSAIRARLYEKGKAPGYRHLKREDWVRVELQIRPQKDAKSRYAHLSPSEVWGASRWTRELAAALSITGLEAMPPGSIHKESERDNKLRWMLRQYSSALGHLAEETGGWSNLGIRLHEMLKVLR